MNNYYSTNFSNLIETGPLNNKQRIACNMAVSGAEAAILVAIFIFLFGAKKIPELARNVGRAKGEFQKGLTEATELESIRDMDRGGMTDSVITEQE